MSGFIDSFTGASVKRARKQAEQQRQQEAVSQARQLSSQASETARTALVRRNPRGRRLFADSNSSLPSTVA